MRTRNTLSLCLSVVFALLVAGCAIKSPPYQASITNVEALRKAELQPLNVGSFTSQSGATGATSIGLRGAQMESSVGAGFADYLAVALQQELELARLLKAQASTEVSGILLKNDISAGGINTNSGEIEARFMVNRDKKARYDRVKRAEMEWESSFAGAVAVPRAQQQYPLMVQKLLGELFADPAFIEACK